MKIYFVRHAPTSANSTGTMAVGYENADITLLDKPDDWEDTVGCHIPAEARRVILSSPTKRCVSTAKMLFDTYPTELTELLGEFDCKALGKLKFWEISETDFNQKVFLPAATMESRARAILSELVNNVRHEEQVDSFVSISHGMVIRYMYHFLNGNPGISAYKVINSVGFRFSNLDLLVVDTDKMKTEDYHWNKPIDHAGVV